MTAASITVDTSAIVDGQGIDAADVITPIGQLKSAVEDTLNGIQAFARISFGTAEALTIASDAISPTQTHVVVDTESGAASDDLKTINNGLQGRWCTLRIASASRVVVIKHGTGNIVTANGNDYQISSVDVWVLLLHNGTNWMAAIMPSTTYANLSTDTTLTIASGAVTKTRARHMIETEGAAAADDLDTINGGAEGDDLFIELAAAAHAVRVRHAQGNILLTDKRHRWMQPGGHSGFRLVYDGTYWKEHLPAPATPAFHHANFWGEVASAATYAQMAMAAGTNAGAGAVSNSNDAEDTYVSQAVAATTGTFGGRKTSTFNLVRGAHNPVFEAIIRTGPDITNSRFWIGLFQQAPTNADTLAASTAAYTFRYSSVAADGGWMAVCNDGTNQSVASLVAAIALSTRYKLRIRVDSVAANVYFSVNDGAEVSVVTNLPGSSVDLGAFVGVITTTNSAKAIAIARYGCRYPGIY